MQEAESLTQMEKLNVPTWVARPESETRLVLELNESVRPAMKVSYYDRVFMHTVRQSTSRRVEGDRVGRRATADLDGRRVRAKEGRARARINDDAIVVAAGVGRRKQVVAAELALRCAEGREQDADQQREVSGAGHRGK